LIGFTALYNHLANARLASLRSLNRPVTFVGANFFAWWIIAYVMHRH